MQTYQQPGAIALTYVKNEKQLFFSGPLLSYAAECFRRNAQVGGQHVLGNSLGNGGIGFQKVLKALRRRRCECATMRLSFEATCF